MNALEIIEIRNNLGLTQAEFAKKVGVDTRTIQNWEAGRKIPVSKHAILRSLVMKPQQYAGGEQSNVNGDNVIGNNVTVQGHDRTGELLALLAAKEKSLEKAQQHIDRLLAIIENVTNK